MDLTAVIFVLLALAWACYLIPMALKHHDEVARTRSVDEFSPAMRVLATREPVNARDTRLVVPGRRRPAPANAPANAPASAPASTSVTRRDTARVAARRRRRILSLLLLSTVGTAVAASLAYAPWWSVAVPGGLALGFLVLCRTQVRREVRREVRSEVRSEVRIPAQRPAPAAVPAQSGPPAVEQHPVDEQRVTDFDDTEDTVDVPVEMLQAAAAATSMPTAFSAQPGGEPPSSSLWDPLPMTLPTYVTAPKARRTVRTIDLGEPGTWTSGRTAEDARIAAEASNGPAADEGHGEPNQRAAGG